mmetsp:Transcript_9029/g.10528  ORF Transcript_9029/g.10528 Transcript_9029/m.10528 type:complete len:125 (-) Transcript_9029:1021-1395(-)
MQNNCTSVAERWHINYESAFCSIRDYVISIGMIRMLPKMVVKLELFIPFRLKQTVASGCFPRTSEQPIRRYSWLPLDFSDGQPKKGAPTSPLGCLSFFVGCRIAVFITILSDDFFKCFIVSESA